MFRRLTLNSVSFFLAFVLGLSSLLGVLVELRTPFGAVRPFDVAIAIWSVVALLRLRKQNRSFGVKVFTVGLLFVWLFSVSYFSGVLSVPAGLYLTRWAVYLWGAWTLSLWLPQQSVKTQQWVDLFAFFWLLMGVGQYLFLPDARILFWLGWDDHLFRAFGVVMDPVFFGLTASVLAWRFWRRLEFTPAMSSILLPLSLVCVVLSYSRLAMLSVAIWIGLEAVSSKQWKSVGFLVPLFACLILFAPRDGGGEGQKLLRTSTLEARQATITQDVSQHSNLLTGNGWFFRQSESLNGVPQNVQVADTFWLQTYLSGGVVAVLGVLSFILVGERKNPIVWWHVGLNLLSGVSFSPWILLASAVVPLRNTGLKFEKEKST